MDKTLLITSVLLLIIGLIMVFSASNITSIMKIDAQTGFNKTINLLEEFMKWLTPFQNMEMKKTKGW